ncbi:MAG TPA: GlsB/YeaQ/YmgE family stress response membrane protein [Marmoricola sp.]|nr:GlsB/YeaQ/YmgE family stress response membrane protein [Marmoricola sp.]
MEIIGLIIAGIIIGLLGKLVAPGDKDNVPIWLTLLCGVGGVLIGYAVSEMLDVKSTEGIDWIRWVISIVIAAVLVIIASTVTGKNTTKTRV